MAANWIDAARERLAAAQSTQKDESERVNQLENEIVDILRGIRDATAETPADQLASMMQRKPAVDQLLPLARSADREARQRVDAIRREIDQYFERLRLREIELTRLLSAEVEASWQHSAQRLLADADKKIAEGQKDRRQVELNIERHATELESHRAELANIAKAQERAVASVVA